MDGQAEEYAFDARDWLGTPLMLCQSCELPYRRICLDCLKDMIYEGLGIPSMKNNKPVSLERVYAGEPNLDYYESIELVQEGKVWEGPSIRLCSHCELECKYFVCDECYSVMKGGESTPSDEQLLLF